MDKNKKTINYDLLISDWLEDINSTIQIYKKKMELEQVGSYHYAFYEGKQYALQNALEHLLFLKKLPEFMEKGILNHNNLLEEWATKIYSNADVAHTLKEQRELGSYDYGFDKGSHEGFINSIVKLTTLESPRKNKKYLISTENTNSKGESNMLHLIQELNSILNRLKGFSAGHSSSNQTEMLVQHNDDVYKITVEKVGKGSIENHMNIL
jgi:hypothetical protein